MATATTPHSMSRIEEDEKVRNVEKSGTSVANRFNLPPNHRLPSRLFHSHPSHPQTWVALHTTDRAMSVGCSRTPQTVTRRDIASDARLARNFLHIDVFVRVRTFDILLFAAPHFLYLSLPIFTPNQRTLFRLPALVVLSRPGQCGLDSRCA